MDLRKFSDATLLDQLKTQVEIERKTAKEILRHLREVDIRKLYLKRGYSSLFAFCMGYLGYSEGAAQRRISAMRLLRDIGGADSRVVLNLESKIENGALPLSHMALVQTALKNLARHENKRLTQTQKLEIIKNVENTTYKECEKRIAAVSPKALPKRDTVTVLTPNEVRVSVTLDAETMMLLERFKELNAHQNPFADTAFALKQALKIAVGALNPLTADAKSKTISKSANLTSRFIRKSVKLEVAKRDEGRCAYVDPLTGRRCESRFKLEFDHKIPISRGGKTCSENLQLLCRAHNSFKSDQPPAAS